MRESRLVCASSLVHGIFLPLVVVAVLFFSERVFGRDLNPFTTGNPFWGTYLLGFSIWGAVWGL